MLQKENKIYQKTARKCLVSMSFETFWVYLGDIIIHFM